MTQNTILPFFILFTIVLFCFQCHSKKHLTIDPIPPPPIQNGNFQAKNNTQKYFPLGIFQDSTTYYVDHDPYFSNSWYSRHLSALKEPILYNQTSMSEVYRFTWLRSFHNPISIRIENKCENIFIYWKRSNGSGGYDPGQITKSRRKKLSESQWLTFINMLDDINFWELKTNDSTIAGFDGAQWILEGNDNTKYHIIDRWSPNKESQYFKTCKYLIGLTDLKIKKRNIY